MITTRRGGRRYYRVADPRWVDPLDPSYAKSYGGRWTPKGEFGALYLCASIEVAAANARRQHVGRAIGLFDLRPDQRPRLIEVDVPELNVVDAVSDAGAADLHLPPTYPHACEHDVCHAIAREAYAAGVDGIACRSNAEATSTSWIGAELAVFDRAVSAITYIGMKRFDQWYPDAIPDSGDRLISINE